jgi:transcriptional regulator with XRE-family HTH domain
MEGLSASHDQGTTNRMVKDNPISPTAIYFTQAIDASGLTQREVARRAGFAKPNVISMMKHGGTKIPIARIPDLARALDVDPREFLATAMEEYQPEIWKVIRSNFSL